MRPVPGFAFKLALLIVDLIVLVTVIFLAQAVRFGEFDLRDVAVVDLALTVFLAAVILYVAGNYDFRLQSAEKSVWPASVLAAGGISSMVIVINYILAKQRAGLFGRGILFGALAVFGLWLVASRAWLRKKQRDRMASIRFGFLVDEEFRRELVKDVASLTIGADFYGFGDSLPPFSTERPLFVQEKWLSSRAKDATDLATARLEGYPVSGLSGFYESYLGKLPVASLSPEWFIVSEGFGLLSRPFSQRIKRLADLIVATVLFVVALPVVGLAAVAIVLESPGGVIYRQKRVGHFGTLFTIYKLRTMRSDAEKAGAQWAAKNDARITRVGAVLRKTRIDELPQLLNILRGDMSFAGPRPERPEFVSELAKQIPYYDLRHVVLPGVTGWAQVMYPYGASVEDARRKLEYDLYYVKHAGLMMDLKILLRTVRTVLGAGGR